LRDLFLKKEDIPEKRKKFTRGILCGTGWLTQFIASGPLPRGGSAVIL
jgi:hypothetical protein